MSSFEGHAGREFKPVNAGLDLKTQRARLVDLATIGVDLPAFLDQPANHGCERTGRDFNVVAPRKAVLQPARPKTLEGPPEDLLKSPITGEATSLLTLYDGPLRT